MCLINLHLRNIVYQTISLIYFTTLIILNILKDSNYCFDSLAIRLRSKDLCRDPVPCPELTLFLPTLFGKRGIFTPYFFKSIGLQEFGFKGRSLMQFNQSSYAVLSDRDINDVLQIRRLRNVICECSPSSDDFLICLLAHSKKKKKAITEQLHIRLSIKVFTQTAKTPFQSGQKIVD